jgi:hypothetical protein
VAELALLGSEIRRRNQETFFSGVSNQAYPINREIGGRWFDETLHGSKTFEAALVSQSGEPSSR